MRCYLFSSCDGAAAQYFTNRDPQATWAKKCECSLQNINPNGVPSGGVHRINVNFNKICNSDYFQGIAENPTCADSVDTASGKMRLQSPSNPQGLTEQDAAFCACYNQRGYNSTNNSSGNGDSLDFRVGQPMQDPLLPEGTGHNYSTGTQAQTFGARETMAVSTTAVRIENGVSTEVAISGNCDRTYCDIRHHAGIDLGCCTANRPVQWTAPVVQLRPGLATLLNRSTGLYPGDWSSYMGYCSPECTGGKNLSIPGRGNVSEITRVREIITGTAPGGTVPPICGSWDWIPSSSSGN